MELRRWKLSDLSLPAKHDSFILQTIAALHKFLDYENGPWIAGGSLRRLLDGEDSGPYGSFDIDVFCGKNTCHKKVAAIVEFSNALLAKRAKARVSIDSLSLPLLQHLADKFAFENEDDQPIQVTHRPELATITELLEDFDFTVCQFATDGEYIYYPEQALRDLTTGVLAVNPKSRIKTPTRFLRYCLYGFNPTKDTVKGLGSFAFSRAGYYQRVENIKCTSLPKLQELTPYLFDSMVLSKVSDIVIEVIDGETIMFIGGAPTPLLLGLIYLYCQPNSQQEVIHLMTETWQRLGVDVEMMKRVAPKITIDQFITAYDDASSVEITKNLYDLLTTN